MLTDVNLWPLIGVAIIIAGFVLRFNPMLVVIVTLLPILAAYYLTRDTDQISGSGK